MHEKLTPGEAIKQNDTRIYIPHHCVTSQSKPSKIRVVYDARTKSNNTCFNDNLLKNLVTILMRFCLGKLVGDIEQLFHQIRIQKKKRDALKFMWTEFSEHDISYYQMTVHLFWTIESLLKKSVLDKSDTLDLAILETIDQDFYMDDFLKSHAPLEYLVNTTNTVISILKQAGLRLT